ncbi:acyl carrier protein [Micromonospora sp. CA-240977]|uniref:acyl carrier protein n=1 Tax=Micromonospora sp. CA-240977 TaxID=3239957 RepID=UPI003D8E055D
MDRQQALACLKDVMCDEFGYPAEGIVETASLRDDVGMDSLDLIDLVSALENRFDVPAASAEISSVRTVGNVVDTILALDAALPPR